MENESSFSLFAFCLVVLSFWLLCLYVLINILVCICICICNFFKVFPLEGKGGYRVTGK